MSRFRPSPEAQAFLADPSNRVGAFDPADLETLRAEMSAAADDARPAILARTGVSLDWEDIAGVPCLMITPSESSDGPDILYFFGGGFIYGSPTDDLMISAVLAAKTGRRVVSPTYSLAPEHPFPKAVDEAVAVAHALPAGIALVGESAGGNLALNAAASLTTAGRSLEALALLSPYCDLTPAPDSSSFPDDPTLPAGSIGTAARIYAGGQDLADPRISPLFADFSQDWPATLVTTATRDALLGHAARLTRAMREAGAPVRLNLWDGLWHVFEYYDIPEAEASLSEIAAFLIAPR